MVQKLKFGQECLNSIVNLPAVLRNCAGRKITDAGEEMTQLTPRTSIDTLEDVPPIDPDPGKIHKQAEKQAANIDGLINLLQTGALLERTKAAVLDEIRDKRGVMPLIGAMNDQSTDVQYVAIKSLGMIAEPRATEPLINALKSGDKWVRLGAARSLGQIGDKIAVDFLIPLLSDPNHGVRANAARALGKLGDTRATEPLQRLLQDPKEDVRTEAETALGLLGVKKSS